MGETEHPWSAEQTMVLLGRIMIAVIFLNEGIGKIGNYAGAVVYARTFGVPGALMPLAIAVELGCGLLLITGFWVRPASVVLAGFCLITTFVFHTNWADHNQLLHFEKDLAMTGGLLILAVCGSQRRANLPIET